MTGIDNAGDLFGEILTDSGKLRQFGSRRKHAPDALRQGFDNSCGAAIGAHAKWVLPLDLKELGGLIEHRRDFCVLHRHGSTLSAQHMP